MAATSATPIPPAALNSSVLFAVTSDPRTSRVPAEAIRIAAGIVAWRKSSLFLYLGLALLNALDDPPNFLDWELVSGYLPGMLDDMDQLLIPSEACDCAFLNRFELNWVPVNLAGLAERTAQCSRVIHF